ncbi:Carnosine N-methyltransferase [Colletotrichum orbiculare MAFF 240422]|uniref:Carnosine N-methyltransferase n=1 Tax=Colletotrichum orbiculare (strain 104-T / ATCC 96160 / CBS 514.97 / LARS 414 / MAFF 240422) TaxID=1213857 RepID=A0A484FCH4_COLOR|nr:Carnosine N-methyltransferase [Colletotrichum orbiculare MAFF 240422]
MRLGAHVTLWLVTGLSCGVLSTGDRSDETNGLLNGIHVQGEKVLASMPVESLLEVHEVIVTVENVPEKPSARHQQEKKSLLKRLSKSHGKWDTNHPRHRLMEALFGFSRYKVRQMAELDRYKGLYKHATSAQKKVLEKTIGYSQKFSKVEKLLDHNQQLSNEIVEAALAYYDISHDELSAHSKAKDEAGQLADRVSVSQALKHYTLFPQRSGDGIRALLPGSGLGRLGHEVASLGGFDVTINEWSMFMNLAYRFLEANPRPESKTVFPFIDSWSHHATTADMVRAVSFPDSRVNSSSVLLIEGDFVTQFKSQKRQYDVVVTHFFIDTARNVMSYFDTIHAALEVGGYWVNFGPLLWGSGPFVQLSLDDIVAIAKSMGFEFVDVDEACGEIILPGEKVRGKQAVYGFNEKALTRNAYSAQFWVAKKVR